MSLIQCKDCGTQISSSAKACPKCGAPVPVTIGPDQQQCPWCMTVVSKRATMCPGCRAQKGYATNKNGVMGKTSTIVFGVILPGILAALFAHWFWPVAVVFGVIALFCIYRLIRGPVWYQSGHPG